MASSQLSLTQLLRRYGPIIGMKMLYIAIAWVAIFFISQPVRKDGSALMLAAPLLGAIAGLVAGWHMAERAVEDSSLTGVPLYVILVIASVLPMWTVEGIFHLLLPAWPMNFGGFMLLTAANLMALASAVWLASSQD